MMNVQTHSRVARGGAITVQLLVALTLVTALLTSSAGKAEARFDTRCKRHPVTCQQVERWSNIKQHQFRSRHMPRTPDRRMWGLWRHYKAAWYKKYGRALTDQQQGRPDMTITGVHTPQGWCSGWGDCFERFVDVANCTAHPIVTAVCLTTDVLDDGIGPPERAELICGGTVLVTAGGNPIAVGRGLAGCYWVWLAWQIFG